MASTPKGKHMSPTRIAVLPFVDTALDSEGNVTSKFRYPRLGAFEVFLRIPSAPRKIVSKRLVCRPTNRVQELTRHSLSSFA